MKVLLSWLNEFAPTSAIPGSAGVGRVADALTALGLEVGSIEHLGARARRRRDRTGPRASTSTRTPTKVQLVDVDAGDGEPRQSGAARSTCRPATSCRSPRSARRCRTARTIERRKHARHRSDGHALFAARARSRRRPCRHPHPAGGDRPRHAATARRSACEPDVLCDLEVNPQPARLRCRSPASPVTSPPGSACRSRLPAPTAPQRTGAEPTRSRVEIVDAERVRPVHRQGPCRASPSARRPTGCAAAWPLAGHATDQQRRRHRQLRDARARPAEAPLRPGHGRRRWLPRPPGPGGERLNPRRASSARSTAEDLLICDAEERPVGIAGVMGGADSEIGDDHDRRRWSRWPGSIHGDRPERRAPRPPPEASARFEKGVDPEGIALATPGSPSCRRDCPEPPCTPVPSTPRGDRCPAEQPVPSAHHRGQRASSAPTWRPTRCRALLDPIGYTVTGRATTATVAMPTWRSDSTAEIDVIEEVARHYGYERIGKTVPKSVIFGGFSARRARRLARAGDAAGARSVHRGSPIRHGLAEAVVAVVAGDLLDHVDLRGRVGSPRRQRDRA